MLQKWWWLLTFECSYTLKVCSHTRLGWAWFSKCPLKFNFARILLVDVRFDWYPVRTVSGLYSPSSLASQGLLVQGLTWISEACRLPGLWWRCQSSEDLCWCVEGRHIQPECALGWVDIALWYASCMRETSGFEPGEYCSCYCSKGESDPWLEHPYPLISSWAIQLHMQPPPCPCIRPLCSKERWLVASSCSRRRLHFKGRRRNQRLIVDL